MTKNQSIISASESWDEKKTATCTHNPDSTTPYLDAFLTRYPSIRSNIQALSAALSNLADEKECTKCGLEDSGRAVVGIGKEVKMAKKAGDFSKEEKKALKGEVKGVLGGLKRELKGEATV